MNIIETVIFAVFMMTIDPVNQSAVLYDDAVLYTDTSAQCEENIDHAHTNAQALANDTGLTVQYIAVCVSDESELEYITPDDLQTAHPTQPEPATYQL